tara:strand:+ start:18100 stop:18564 length:465 start_codon:yes stop_codon:yes gene_type:complete
VILQGVFTRKVFTLSEVKEAKWDVDHLIVDPKTKAGDINLNQYDQEDRLWLIRYFRHELPPSSQVNWDRFCLRFAIPLQDRLQAELRPPESDEILVTRQRYDRIGIPLNVILSLIGFYISWKLNHFAVLILPAFSIGFWLLLRYTQTRHACEAT